MSTEAEERIPGKYQHYKGNYYTAYCVALDAWLQNGYKNFKDAINGLKYVEFVDELRIISAVFHEKSRPSSRVGVNSK